MIKLKDLLLENEATHPFIPHKIEGRLEKLIQAYRNNGSKGDLDLSNMKLTKFPDALRFIDVGGNFDCRRNQLTSLEGAPTSVSGNFYCHNNQLTSLVGSPKSVGGNFTCSDTQLKSLEGAPESVGGNFTCSHNQLTSLEGAPKSIGGDFYCGNNAVKFTEEQIRSFCDVKGKIYL